MLNHAPQPDDRMTVFDVQDTGSAGQTVYTSFIGVIAGRCYRAAATGDAAATLGDVIIITRINPNGSNPTGDTTGIGVVGTKSYELAVSELIPDEYGWVSTSNGEEGLWTPDGNLIKLNFTVEGADRWYHLATLEPGTYIRLGFEGNRVRPYVIRVDQDGPRESFRQTLPLLPEHSTQLVL
ncbi:MAG TPA: hypothetical protein VMR75_01265 [Candidatus Saccharimonadales bacterium]|nr:hypothetical protein [Candidatus Saccharimonadales bacterium]